MKHHCLFIAAAISTIGWASIADAGGDYRTLNNKATQLAASGHPEQAIPILVQAVHSAQDALGADDDVTVTLIYNLAQLYLTSDSAKPSAVPYLKRVLDHDVKKYGDDDPRVAEIYYDLGRANENSLDQAPIEDLHHAIKIYEHDKKTKNPNYIRALYELGYVYLWGQEVGKGRSMLHQALKQSEAIFGRDAEITGEAHYKFAQFDIATRSYGAAERHLLAALDIFGKKLPAADPRTLAVRAALVPVYEETGKSSEAMEQTMELAMLAPDVKGQDQPLFQVAPDFSRVRPVDAFKGPIDVRFTVLADGHVGKIEFTSAQTSGTLKTAVKNALSKWIYKPRVVNGKPVESEREIRFIAKVPGVKG